MSDRSDLKKVAKAVWDLSHRSEWLGGTGQSRDWPKNIQGFVDKKYARYGDRTGWDEDVTWTLSPEVQLAGHRVRVCVSWDGREGSNHHVRVFVDDELKHPGGQYYGWNGNWFGGWSWRIAKMEREDGGKTGPVDARDLVLEAAKQGGDAPPTPPPIYCDLCYQALTDVERKHHEERQQQELPPGGKVEA